MIILNFSRSLKKPNKAPEPTPMSVTPRAPSSTSRASHGRGSSLTFGKKVMRAILVASFMVAAGGCVAPPRASPVTEVDWRSIGYGVAIIGKLGVPLGEMVEIEAVIVSGRVVQPESKSLQSAYLLRVEKVGAQVLPIPQLAMFATWDSEVSLPRDAFGLFERKEGRKAGSLSRSQIEELERDYLGRRLRLLVFEEGSFDGYPPSGLPEDQRVIFQKIEEPGLSPNQPWPRFRPLIKVLRVIEPNQSSQPTPGS